jgi:hypothetical protein
LRAINIEAKSLESARALYAALSKFDPELVGNKDDGYRVSIDLGGGDSQIVAVLDALETHVTERAGGPARVELDGRHYTLHGEPPIPDTDEPTQAG